MALQTTSNPLDLNSALATGGLSVGNNPTTPALSQGVLPPTQTTPGLNIESSPTATNTTAPVVPPPPVKKPVTTVSSDTATQQATGIQGTLSTIDQQKQAAADKAAADKAAADAELAKKPVPPTPTTPTAEDKIADQPEPGYTSGWNMQTGARQDFPIGSTPPAGVTTVDPTNGSYTAEADAGTGISVRQLADGKYVLWNTTTNTVAGGATAQQFSDAQSAQTAKQAIANLQKGIYNPKEQAQLDQINALFDRQLQQLNLRNSNITGGQELTMARSGLAGSSIGQQSIEKSVTDGIQRVTDLNTSREAAIQQMKDAFLANDSKMLSAAYDTYNNFTKTIQATLTATQKILTAAETKQKNDVTKLAFDEIKLHPNAGITGQELTPQDIIDKVTAAESKLSTYANANVPSDDTKNLYDPLINNTPNAVYQDALSILAKGNSALTGLGLGQASQVQAYRNAVKAKAAAIADSMGISEAQSQTLFKINADAAKQNIERLSRVESITNSVIAQMPRLASLADKVKSEGINFTESDLQSKQADIERKFGNTDAAQYLELVQTIRADYAANNAALAGSRGGEFFAKTANDAIPVGLSGDQYNAIKDTMVQSASNIRDGVNKTVDGLIGVHGNSQSPTVSSSMSTGTTPKSTPVTVGKTAKGGLSF